MSTKSVKYDVILKRLKVLTVVTSNSAMSPREQLAVIAEFASMGYEISNPEILDTVSFSALQMEWPSIKETLLEMRGGDVDYVPLFQGFPENVPDQDEYLLRRIVGYFFGATAEEMFNMSMFGADPITGFQTKELYERGKIRQANRKSDTSTNWIKIEVLGIEDALVRAREFMLNCFYAKSPIKETMLDEVFMLANMWHEHIDVNKISLRENLALYAKHLWEKNKYDKVASVLKTPTDVLRLMALLTDSDVSLATPIKFPRLNRVQRRTVLSVLDNAGSSIVEDMIRYKGLWVRFGEYLHPGEYKTRYFTAYDAFQTLRNDKYVTFNGSVEQAIEDKDVKTTLLLLSTRPGVFARKLHELMRKLPVQKVIKGFNSVAPSVPLKTLLLLKSYFRTINLSENRCIVNKKGKMKVIANDSLGMLSRNALSSIQEVIKGAIHDRLHNKTSMGNVWIDPELDGYVVPLQQRKASDGLIPMARGSQFNLGDEKVLRLFIYWKDGGTDLDLSVVQYDKNMEPVGQVSFTNLRSKGDDIVHSGDILRAPHGAAEFIDITLSALPANVCFLAVQVNKYSGSNFNELERCYAGYMMRDKCSSDRKSFDAKTVVHKMNVAGTGRQSLPIVVDLRRKKVIYVDLYKAADAYTRVENTLEDVTTFIKEVMKFTETRPNLYDLAFAHANARGKIVEDKDDADVTFGLDDDCDYSPSDIEKILAELL